MQRNGVGVAHRQRQHAVLPIAADVEKARSLRRAKPLVAVAGVVRGADPAHVQRQHPRRVRAVDQRVHSALGERAHQRLDREHQPGGAGHVIDEGQPRARRDRGEHRVDHPRRRDARPGHGGRDHADPCGLEHAEGVAAGVVGVVGGEHLVAVAEAQRAHHGVHPGGRIGHERQIVGIGAHEPGQREARLVEQRLQLAREEQHGLPLHPRAQLLLQVEHAPRAGAERAVVQELDLRVQCPVPGQLGFHAGSFSGARLYREPRRGARPGGRPCAARRELIGVSLRCALQRQIGPRP